jgi:hypothetical protein
MGLFVLPIYATNDPGRIDHLQVSAVLPAYIAEQSTKDAAGATVPVEMSRPNVGMTIEPAKDCRGNVVDFPAHVGKLAVLGPTNDPAVAVDPVVVVGPVGSGVIPSNSLSVLVARDEKGC